jgi:hypothetical protein
MEEEEDVDDMDYEPTTEDDSEELNEHDFLEMILGQAAEGAEEDEEEDG